MPGQEYYSAIGLLPSPADPRRLTFSATAGAASVPDDMVLLRQDYERTARIVSILFEDNVDERRRLFDLIHRGADRGLRGPNHDINDGRANLIEIKETILDAALAVRSRFLRAYTLLALAFGIVPLVAGIWILLTGAQGFFTRPAFGQGFDPLYAWIVAALWIAAGAAICVWGEFALRMQGGLSYDSLLNLDPSRWRPGQRLLVTVGIAFIFAYLLALNVVQVGFGGLLLNDFIGKVPAMALAVGGVTGLAFSAVQDLIFKVKPTVK